MATTAQKSETTAAAPSRVILWVVLALLLAAGLGVRLYHISEPPLDFHAQRQYWDAHRARLMYYETLDNIRPEAMAAAKMNAESSTGPLVIENLAVLAYRLAGEENLALPRALMALAYVIGGLFLFLLALRLFRPAGAVAALAYYLFLPFAVQSTRTFQPDPLMTAAAVIGIYFIYRYFEEPSLKRLLWTAPFVAFAIYTKPMSLFFVVAVFAVFALARIMEDPSRAARRRNLRGTLNHGVLFAVFVLAGTAWYVVRLLGQAADPVKQQASKSFIPSLFTHADYWTGWLNMLGPGTLQFWALAAGLVGVILCRDRMARRLLLGGWLGYLAYFFVFNYHVATHSYYNLPLVPVAALSLGALVSALQPALLPEDAPWRRRAVWAVFALVLVFGIGKTAAQQAHPEYAEMLRDYREIGGIVGHGTKNVFLAYGYGDPLKYHGVISGSWWPAQVDLSAERVRGEPSPPAAERLRKLVESGYEYFIVTAFPGSGFQEFAMQPELQAQLAGYPLVAQTPRYLVFDLRPRVGPLPR